MAYQVLARKWRPKAFSEVVGQKHVLQALINALNNNRLHHAYLFSGTRGVGKTTLGRIFAKSLNCETGIGAQPCGVCTSCKEIDEGRFVDLLEVDAASRTKVDETRELLENVQYAPSRGQFKVYLIDEVHMLTTHSFNALLKTLEEPPPHVKFILATTDPQKLPVTILSRCLKFNLNAISPELITEHMSYVLGEEKINFDIAALKLISRSAKGSMRDALSLLDQAIAHGNGAVLEQTVREMLGTIDNRDVLGVIKSLIDDDASALLQQVQLLATQGVVFPAVLAELVSTLHMLAMAQVVPDAIDEEHRHLLTLASQLSADELQLYYQIALMGQNDLPLAPDPRAGFEMVMLRMFAFKPDDNALVNQSAKSVTNSSVSNAAGSTPGAMAKKALSNRVGVSGIAATANQAVKNPSDLAVNNNSKANAMRQSEQPQSDRSQIASQSAVLSTDGEQHKSAAKPVNYDWESIVNQLPLAGMARQLISNSQFIGKTADGIVELKLDEMNANLAGQAILDRVEQALATYYNEKIKLKIITGELQEASPAEQRAKRESDALQDAVVNMQADPNIIELETTFGTKLNPRSVKLIDKTDG